MQPYTYSSLPVAPDPPPGGAVSVPVPGGAPPRPEIDRQALDADGLLVPHHRTFQAVYNLFSKTYSYRWDEAVRHGLENAQAMRRDTYFRALMAERLDPLGHWDWTVSADPDPLNPKDPYSADKDRVARMLKAEAAACPALMKFRRHLGWCAWFGRVGNQVLYEPSPAAGLAWNPRVPVLWEPVDGDKLQWAWGDDAGDRRGHWCVYINPTSRGEYPAADTAINDRTTLLRLRRPDYRRRFVIGTHEIEDAPYEDVFAAGRSKGVGLRDFVYWGWWLRDEMLSWMVSLAEKAGTLGILLFKYPAGNVTAKEQAEKNAKEVSNRNALTVPVQANTRGEDYGVEVVALPTNGLQFLKEVTFDYFDKHFERLFVGQTLSAGTEGGGLGGSGVAGMHEDTKFARLKFDAENQGEYLTTDFVGVLRELNHRDAPGVYRWKYLLPDPKAKDKLDAITTAASLPGKKLAYKADEVRELVGLSKPEPGDEVVGGDDPAQAGGPGKSGPGGAAPPGQPPVAGGTGGAGPQPSPGGALPAPPVGPEDGNGSAPPSDDEVADAVAALIGQMNAAIGVAGEGNRDAILAAVRAKKGRPPVAYEAATPPWPGAVFDRQSHRWKVGRAGSTPAGGAGSPAPSAPTGRGTAAPQPAGGFDANAVLSSLGREHAAALADPRQRASAAELAEKLYLTVAGWLLRLSPGVRAAAEALLDTPEDMQKFGYNPTSLGTHHVNGDPVAAATGVNAHLAMTIASKVLAAAWVKGKRALAGPPAAGPVASLAAEPANPNSSPPPAPAAAAPQTPAPAGGSWKSHPVTAKLAGALKIAPGLSDGKRAEYGWAAAHVLGRMTPAARDRLAANLGQAHFHPDNAAVGLAVADELQSLNPGASARVRQIVEAGGQVGGAYLAPTRALHTDGGLAAGGQTTSKNLPENTTPHIYAHEWAHAVDGPTCELSSSPAWQEAFAAEFGNGRLTKYASTRPSEAWAEFARLVWASPVPAARVEASFPKAVAVWREAGLWPV